MLVLSSSRMHTIILIGLHFFPIMYDTRNKYNLNTVTLYVNTGIHKLTRLVDIKKKIKTHNFSQILNQNLFSF